LKILPIYEDEKFIPALLTPLLNVQFAKDKFIDFVIKLYNEILIDKMKDTVKNIIPQAEFE